MAHGGGCGCKLSPAVLQQVLAKIPAQVSAPNLLVGTETSDDAAVYQLNAQQAVISTTDFFTPIVDDPFDFGRIAATNALSDVYAMGGKPIFALAIVGMPIDKIPMSAVQEILRGGAAVCASAGIPIAGGHSIDSPEPIYGLAVTGIVNPARVLRNNTARAGDCIILSKPLGVGIYSAALKRQQLSAPQYDEMLQAMTQLNAVGAEVAQVEGGHSMTDVTGFGLLGHLLEMCRGAQLGAELDFAKLPLLRDARRLSEAGVGTGGAKRNWLSYGAEVELPETASAWPQEILCDPQTSGGLLIACSQAAADTVLALLRQHNFAQASVIGQFKPGPARVTVKALL